MILMLTSIATLLFKTVIAPAKSNTGHLPIDTINALEPSVLCFNILFPPSLTYTMEILRKCRLNKVLAWSTPTDCAGVVWRSGLGQPEMPGRARILSASSFRGRG